VPVSIGVIFDQMIAARPRKDHPMMTFRCFARASVAFLPGAFLLGFLALGAAISSAKAQDPRAPSDIQRDYDQFIVKFRVALKANDAAAVTEMTKFPFYWDQMRDAVYFRQNLYGKIFTTRIRNCLARARGVYARAPNGEENFTLFCGEDLFLFTRTPAGFRFAETGSSGG
jgi:hypothetical protein